MSKCFQIISIALPIALMVGCSSKPVPVTDAVVQPKQVCQNVVDTLTSLDQKASYALGQEIGTAFQGIDAKHIDLAAFSQGVRDVLSDSKPLLTAEDALQVKREFFELIRKEAADAEKAKGEAFRAEWAKKNSDAVKTESGLLYRMVSPGSEKRAQLGDEVAVHYSGKLIDGTEFDSSYKRETPFIFKLQPGMVIEGWNQMLLLIPEGGTVEVVIPPELAYGERDMRIIPANATLIFQITLIKINPSEAQVEALMKGEPMPADEVAGEGSEAAVTPDKSTETESPEAEKSEPPKKTAQPAPSAEKAAPKAAPKGK